MELDYPKYASVAMHEDYDNDIVVSSHQSPRHDSLQYPDNIDGDGNTQWGEAMRVLALYVRNYQSLMLTIYSMPTHPRGLPASIDLQSMRTIADLSINWYPGLKSIDVSTLRHLTSLRITATQYSTVHPPIPDIPRLTDLRVIGVFKCIYLTVLHVLNGSEQPYRLKIGARVCNLQVLETLKIARTRATERVPFEFGASVSLKCVHYYDDDMTRYRFMSYRDKAAETEARRFRFYWKLAKAVCITIKHAFALRDRPIVKLWARGPMHHPSVIFDIARCFFGSYILKYI